MVVAQHYRNISYSVNIKMARYPITENYITCIFLKLILFINKWLYFGDTIITSAPICGFISGLPIYVCMYVIYVYMYPTGKFYMITESLYFFRTYLLKVQSIIEE